MQFRPVTSAIRRSSARISPSERLRDRWLRIRGVTDRPLRLATVSASRHPHESADKGGRRDVGVDLEVVADDRTRWESRCDQLLVAVAGSRTLPPRVAGI